MWSRLAMLIAPGTSLGGARLKANFIDDEGRLWMAKFPAKDDRYDVGGWECLAHLLAREAGVVVQRARVEYLPFSHGTFCSAQFDRTDAGSRTYASAMTFLERQDGEPGARCLDLAECSSDHGAEGHVDVDLAELSRRVVFNILLGNRDDHLRHHRFIREPSGWRLAPAFEIKPATAKQRHALTMDGRNAEPDVRVAIDQAEWYRSRGEGPGERSTRYEVLLQTGAWLHGVLQLPGVEVQRMESVTRA